MYAPDVNEFDHVILFQLHNCAIREKVIAQEIISYIF